MLRKLSTFCGSTLGLLVQQQYLRWLIAITTSARVIEGLLSLQSIICSLRLYIAQLKIVKKAVRMWGKRLAWKLCSIPKYTCFCQQNYAVRQKIGFRTVQKFLLLMMRFCVLMWKTCLSWNAAKSILQRFLIRAPLRVNSLQRLRLKSSFMLPLRRLRRYLCCFLTLAFLLTVDGGRVRVLVATPLKVRRLLGVQQIICLILEYPQKKPVDRTSFWLLS